MLDPLALRLSKRVRALLITGLTGVCALGLASVGTAPGVPPGLSALALLHALFTSGLVALVYLGAAVGLGVVLARRVLRVGSERWWIGLALGPAFMLWLSHALGCVGLLSGEVGRLVALATCALGLVLLALECLNAARARPNLPLPPQMGLLWCAGGGTLLCAACNPPGWLWASEGRGYDTLSYHLQLPQEWLRLGRLVPLEHNVYSYLPGAMEAAFLHIGAMLGPWRTWAMGAAARPQGLLAADGLGAIACQLVHAGLAVICAVLVARIVCLLVRRTVPGDAGLARVAAEAGALAGAAVLAVPWVVVAGSMAYNDLAACALIAGGVLAAVRPGEAEGAPGPVNPIRVGLVCGFLVGMAGACKPTAVFFAAPLVGCVLAVELGGPRAALRLVLCAAACVAGGLAALAPPLARNGLHGGNPLFPAATGLLGSAHWSAEQVERFALAHREDSGLADRVGLLIERRGRDGESIGGEPRGVFHTQWGGLRVKNPMIALDVPAAFFPVGALCGVAALTWRRRGGAPPARVKRVALALWAGSGAGLAWWVLGSHCQSRFLLPLVVPGAVLIGLAWARLGVAVPPGPLELPRRLGLLALGVLPIWLGAAGVLVFVGEGNGRPNALLPDGCGLRTGAGAAALLARTRDPAESAAIVAQLGPEAYVNLCVPPGAGVALVGDGTPLYSTRPVLYATTWDAHPLATAMRDRPDDPGAWAAALRAGGIDYLVVNFNELGRLRLSGYLDPAFTPDGIGRLLERACVPVRQWEESGQALFRLSDLPVRETLPTVGGAGGGA